MRIGAAAAKALKEAPGAPRPVRVLHLVNSQQHRGAETFSLWLAEKLSPDRFDSLLCSIYATEERFDDSPVQVWDMAVPKSRIEHIAGWDPRVVLQLRRLVHAWRPDVIIAHGSRSLKYSVLAKRFHPDVRVIYRNIGMASYWARPTFKVTLNRLLLKQVDRIISVSDVCRRDFLGLYEIQTEKAVTIFTGVRTELFHAPTEEEAALQRHALGLNAGDLVLISVGCLSPDKGHADLIPVLSRLHAAGWPAHLLVVGDGPLRGILENQALEAGLGQTVHFLGTRTDVHTLLKAADLFVLSSRTEGMAAVLIEAGLAGLTAVSYDVGGVREVIEQGRTGILVPSGDQAAMTEAIAILAENPGLRRQIGARARESYLRTFDIRNIALQYEEVIAQVLRAEP